MSLMPKKSQEFNKVAECLYRNGNRLYYALVKVSGKQIRRRSRRATSRLPNGGWWNSARKPSGWRAKKFAISGSRNLWMSGSLDQVRPQAEVLRPLCPHGSGDSAATLSTNIGNSNARKTDWPRCGDRANSLPRRSAVAGLSLRPVLGRKSADQHPIAH